MNPNVVRFAFVISVMLISVIVQTSGFARIRAKLIDKRKREDKIELIDEKD
jgi:hypothetical protein